MKLWPKHPFIYEINTWVWLSELSRKYERLVNLATAPEEEWDTLAFDGFDSGNVRLALLASSTMMRSIFCLLLSVLD
jgi:hypothetical protein